MVHTHEGEEMSSKLPLLTSRIVGRGNKKNHVEFDLHHWYIYLPLYVNDCTFFSILGFLLCHVERHQFN